MVCNHTRGFHDAHGLLPSLVHLALHLCLGAFQLELQDVHLILQAHYVLVTAVGGHIMRQLAGCGWGHSHILVGSSMRCSKILTARAGS